MIWENCTGWYDWHSGTCEMIGHFSGGKIVEVGSYLGKSLCATADEIVKSGKPYELYSVDHCIGSGLENGNDNHGEALKRGGGNLAGLLYQNVIDCGFKDVVTLIVAPSVRAASMFADSSLTAVILDAGHDYVSITNDIKAWKPKLRSGGWLVGDDLIPDMYPGIVQAVEELLPGYTKFSWDSWRYIIP